MTKSMTLAYGLDILAEVPCTIMQGLVYAVLSSTDIDDPLSVSRSARSHTENTVTESRICHSLSSKQHSNGGAGKVLPKLKIAFIDIDV